MIVDIDQKILTTIREPMQIRNKEGADPRDMTLRDVLVKALLNVETDEKGKKLSKKELLLQGNLAKELLDSHDYDFDTDQLTLLESLVTETEGIWILTQVCSMLSVREK